MPAENESVGTRGASFWARAFGRFLWDFLIGDTPEIFLSAVIALGLVASIVHAGGANALAVAAGPLLVACALSISLVRAARAGRARRS